jgi:hypothetical protein
MRWSGVRFEAQFEYARALAVKELRGLAPSPGAAAVPGVASNDFNRAA